MLEPVKPKIVLLISKNIGLQMLTLFCQHTSEYSVEVFTIDDSSDERSKLTDIRRVCSEQNLSLSIINQKTEVEERLLLNVPEQIYVAGWYWLISQSVLDSVKGGVIGIHHSLLPKYRGGAPLVWAIIHGERRVGSSLFVIKPGVDDGPIILQTSIQVADNEYIDSIAQRLERKMLALIRTNLKGVLQNKLPLLEQDHSEATTFPQRKPQDGQIDLSRSAQDIYNFIRAQAPPYPGAFIRLGNEDLYIFRCELLGSTAFSPSGVLTKEKIGLVLNCRDGRILLTKYIYRTV